MTNDLLYQVALTLVPNIGAVHARILIEHFGSAGGVFLAKQYSLDKIEGIGTVRANAIKRFTNFERAEQEIEFIEKYAIKPLFITDPQYPKRLLNCYDPPTLLFYKGNADLNASKIIAIVGTRNNTEYGKQVTEKLVKDLSAQPVLIISGLAFGIDTIAHKAAVKNKLPTVGVVGHGLDIIYPGENTGLAKDMVKQEGGVLTQFPSKTKPDKHNFPIRNRIVAGLADATIIVETTTKGGSMITAEMANGYNRDVFAVPGRTTDGKSAGSNYLIKNNKAILLTDAQQLVEIMGWEDTTIRSGQKPRVQRELFIPLTPEETCIVNILNEKEHAPIDEINLKSGLSSSSVAAAILNLELQGVIVSLPGKMYKLQ